MQTRQNRKRKATNVGNRAVKKLKRSAVAVKGQSHKGPASNAIMLKGHAKSGKNTKKAGGKKDVKVSSKFVASVKKAISLSTPTGYYTERFYNKYIPVDFNQAVFNVGTGNGEPTITETGLSDGIAMFFDPYKVLDAASVLFNFKGANGTKNNNNAGLFPAQAFSVDVKKQWVRMEFKNNSARRLQMKVWTWELKGNTALNLNFSAYWATQLTKDAALVDGAINPLNNSVNTMGQSPMFNPGVKRYFKIFEEDILIEPGKSYIHYVQGPSKRYDFSKFWSTDTVFNNFQKGNKGVCIALCTDITGLAAGVVGATQRYTDMTNAGGYGLQVETQFNYIISLPDQTGYRVTNPLPANNSAQPLMKRRGSPYACVNWNQVNQGVAIVQPIDDENPQAPAVGGV